MQSFCRPSLAVPQITQPPPFFLPLACSPVQTGKPVTSPLVLITIRPVLIAPLLLPGCAWIQLLPFLWLLTDCSGNSTGSTFTGLNCFFLRQSPQMNDTPPPTHRHTDRASKGEGSGSVQWNSRAASHRNKEKQGSWWTAEVTVGSLICWGKVYPLPTPPQSKVNSFSAHKTHTHFTFAVSQISQCCRWSQPD